MESPTKATAPVSRPDLLDALYIIKGRRELQHPDTIDPESIRIREFHRRARMSSIPLMHESMLRLFKRWGITDEDWIFAFATAAVELITNVVQHVQSLPRGKRLRHVRILFLMHTGRRHAFVYAFVSDHDDEPIDVTRLKTRIRRPSLATHGRGTALVKALTDLYAIIRGTDGVIIMKKTPRR